MPLLRAENLSHTFEYPLFEHVTFDLSAGESMAILGVSGCGKSTLMHICSTLLKPTTGTVRLFDQSIYALKEKERLALRRYDVGIVFQAHYLFKGFLSHENIELASLISGQNVDDTLLQRLGIAHVMHQKVGELSGGQQQRVSIARVLSKHPKIIFADEPTGNLDDKTAHEVMDVLFEYVATHRAALLLVTHNHALAQRCTHKRYLHATGLSEEP